MNADELLLSEVILDASGGAPSAFRILAAGLNETRKGPLLFDEEAADLVMAEFATGKVDLPIDYAHAMARPMTTAPTEQIAAGWFRPEIRDGELWAADVTWTPKGSAAVQSREFRYTSLWGDIAPTGSGDEMRLIRLRNVALTNTPATIGTLPLVASESEERQSAMADKSIVLALLGCDSEAEAVEHIRKTESVLSDLEATLGVGAEALGASARALKLRAEQGDKAAAELSELRAKAEVEARDRLVAELSEAGKLPPALHAWAKTQSIESLRIFGEHAPRLVEPSAAPTAPAPAASDSLTLTEEEKAVARALGLDPSAVAKHKARRAGLEG